MALWHALADLIAKVFGAPWSPLQVQNQWKSLERAYKRTKSKNNLLGNGSVSCEFEEDSLDTGMPNDVQPASRLEAAVAEPAAEQVAVEEAEPSSRKKRKRVDGTPLQVLLEEFKESRKERDARFTAKNEPSRTPGDSG
ncbi:hypothetical protein MTO96_033787 [Rhipicephalus appendiculatus]